MRLATMLTPRSRPRYWNNCGANSFNRAQLAQVCPAALSLNTGLNCKKAMLRVWQTVLRADYRRPASITISESTSETDA